MHDGEEEPCSYFNGSPGSRRSAQLLDDSATTAHKKRDLFPVVRRTEYRHNYSELCIHVVQRGDSDDRRLQSKIFAARHQNAFREMYGVVVYKNHSKLLVGCYIQPGRYCFVRLHNRQPQGFCYQFSITYLFIAAHIE